MSKKPFRAQASSARVASTAFGAFGSPTGTFALSSSPLSYVYEAPDLAAVSDANIRVIVQRLMKKDGTTKSKALEELDLYVSSLESDTLQHAILSAWVILYPRLSIDPSRRVRLLAHTVTGRIATKIGKQIAPHLSKLAPPWLAGTHDADRATAKAALDALNNLFPRPQKHLNLLQSFHEPILQYCVDAITNETPDTLCDTRVVSADDAQATHARVVSTAIAVIASDYIIESSDSLFPKQRPIVDNLLSDTLLWSCSASPDVTIRKSLFSLLIACADYSPDLLGKHLSSISTHIVDKALHSDQTGSAADLLRSLVDLTRLDHQIWTNHYTGKKPALHRLNQIAKRGCQSSSADFWSLLVKLVDHLVKNKVLPQDETTAKALLLAVHQGATQPIERTNGIAPWNAYLEIYCLLQSGLGAEPVAALAEATLHPLIEHHLFPDQDTAKWNVPLSRPEPYLAAVCRRVPVEAFVTLYERLSAQLTEMIKVSSPEQSKDFTKSQKHVGAVGGKWARLTASVVAPGSQQLVSIYTDMQRISRRVVQESLALLRARGAKPYGAAMVLEEAVKAFASMSFVFAEPEVRDDLHDYLITQSSIYINTPSRSTLFSLVYNLPEAQFAEVWSAISSVLGQASTESRSECRDYVCDFLQAPRVQRAAEFAKSTPHVQTFLQHEAQQLASSRKENPFLGQILRSAPQIMSDDTVDAVLSFLLGSLDTSDDSAPILGALKGFVGADNQAIKQWSTTAQGSKLLPKLLQLEEAAEDDSIAKEASTLSDTLLKAVGNEEGVFKPIQQSLAEIPTSASIPVATLIEMLERSLGPNASRTIETLVPDQATMSSALEHVMQRPPPALSGGQSLFGLVYFTDATSQRSFQPAFDNQGYSQAVRISILVTTVLKNEQLAPYIDSDLAARLLSQVSHTLMLIDDSLEITGNSSILARPLPAETELLMHCADARAVISSHLVSYAKTNSSSAPIAVVLNQCLETARNITGPTITPSVYCSIRVASRVNKNIGNMQGITARSTELATESLLKSLQARSDYSTVVLLSIYQDALWQGMTSDSPLKRLINELVAELTTAGGEQDSEEVLKTLLKFNAATEGHTLDNSIVASQRLVFLTKNLLSWLDKPDILDALRAQTYQAFRVLLPSIREVYGEQWTQVLQSIQKIWKRPDMIFDSGQAQGQWLPLIDSTLQVLRVMHDLTTEEDPNDDLSDAWKAQSSGLTDGLVALLLRHQNVPDNRNNILEVTNKLIGRSFSLLPSTTPSDTSVLYPLLTSPSASIQNSALLLLRTSVLTSQEQITFDAALENKAAHLPTALLSLITQPPTNQVISDNIPAELQSYLFSWVLVFEHFTGATSHKVKSDYIEELKAAGCLSFLLDLVYEGLGHARGRPIDVSSQAISQFEPSSTTTPGKQETQALLAHLLYLSLLYAPSLTKSHYRSIKSRQTSLAVSSWASKHISPLIIATALGGVSDWAQTTVKTDPDYADMSIKVSSRSREVNASYFVDGQTMAITIRLPEEYPLENATINGPAVVVDEKRWTGWLRTSQAQMTFNNGNLIDAISTWFRNVTGALKGQTECAICYSIISADKQLPSKRCSTCKQLFHGSCLFKWFKSSNASTCPLCRNPFNYG